MSDSEPARRRPTGAETDDTTGGSSAVVTRPARPTGKRARRAPAGENASEAVDLATGTKAETTKNGDRTSKRAARKSGDGKGRRNPLAFVWNYLAQVVAELRKVIWPNRKQMVNYTIVVLVFLAFMVALIAGVDYGFTRLIMLLFG